MKYVLLSAYCLATFHSHAQTKDTFELYFPFNKSIITTEIQDRIDALIFKDTLIHGDKLILLGYADYVGGKGHNDSLSYRRANAVRNYLLKYGFDKKDITLCIGKGKIERNNVNNQEGFAPDRKVQIVIDRSQSSVALSPAAPMTTKTIVKGSTKPEKKIDSLPRVFQLNNIIFRPNNDQLVVMWSNCDLNTLVDFLKENPKISIGISVDMRGWDTPFDRTLLSENRAWAIRRYLTRHGIPDRQTIWTAGALTPQPGVKYEIPPEEKQTNPRVIIDVHKTDAL